MNVDELVVKRLEELHTRGYNVRRSIYEDENYIERIDHKAFGQWQTSCLSLLERVFGTDSVHYRNFESATRIEYKYVTLIDTCLGVVAAAQDDYQNGFLFNLRQLVEADLFSDLLDQANHLSQSGYYAPAAVIAGCILEDSLRKACISKGIELPRYPKLDWMNAELVRVGTYNKLVQKHVTFLAGIRNSAAHGNWGDFTEDDVKAMLTQVPGIIATYLS